MKAPIERLDQMELMKTAKERHDERVQRWKQDATIMETIKAPAEKQLRGYTRTTQSLQVKRCA